MKRILIIDDDDEFSGELRETLSLNGYDAFSVSDTLLALDKAVKIQPDLILLDLKMPGKNGFQIADEIRRYSALESTPVICMTAFFREEYISLMNMCDIKKCVKKPFNTRDVLSQIKTILGT